MYDSRAVANRVLETAKRHGLALTNLKLQKLLYFMHGRFLIEQGRPLLEGDFEAWKFGPVHPVVYSAFKEFGAEVITAAAQTFDPITRSRSAIPSVSDELVEQYIDSVVSSIGRMSPGQLVDLTHVKGGPWDRTVREAEHSANLGMKIKNETIRQHFYQVKIVTRQGEEQNVYGDVRENAPYTGD